MERLKKRLCEAVDFMFYALETARAPTPHGNGLFVKISEGQYRPLSSAVIMAYCEAANALERIPSGEELKAMLAKSFGDATYQMKKSNPPSEQIQSGPKISKLPDSTWRKILKQAGISIPKNAKKPKS